MYAIKFSEKEAVITSYICPWDMTPRNTTEIDHFALAIYGWTWDPPLIMVSIPKWDSIVENYFSFRNNVSCISPSWLAIGTHVFLFLSELGKHLIGSILNSVHAVHVSSLRVHVCYSCCICKTLFSLYHLSCIILLVFLLSCLEPWASRVGLWWRLPM